jgi:hypothetical protein
MHYIFQSLPSFEFLQLYWRKISEKSNKKGKDSQNFEMENPSIREEVEILQKKDYLVYSIIIIIVFFFRLN